MVLTVVIIAVLLFAPVVHAEECALQDYDTETAPDFMCQGPEEAELLPSSTYPPPIPYELGQLSVLSGMVRWFIVIISSLWG